MDQRYSKKAVGTRLKEFRNSMHMTQQEFSDQMQWDVNTYRKIETGASLLTSDKAQSLHEKYNVDINYILTGDRPDSENILIDLWISAPREEKNRMLIRLLKYWEGMLEQ